MIHIEIFEGPVDSPARTIQFSAEPSAHMIKIGRVASAQLRFENDDQVSRMHAIIERNHDGIFIIDLGSVLGTYVNDQKISRRKLSSGDVISIGRQRLRVTIVLESTN